MAESTTIARPYAKAIFEEALAEKKLGEWSEYLQSLAQAVETPAAAAFIDNPASTIEQHIELMCAVMGKKVKENKSLDKVITLLAINRRLMVLPAIKAIYDVLKAEQEKTLDVVVVSYSAMSADQQKKLTESLSHKLQRKVSLKISIDPSLLGGAVVQAGDLVIDGSVRGKLNKLGTDLAA
jgi:F-type H+-transporting ATPase subunit delta